jgi:hypothetical protein
MPIHECDPWREQYFRDIACPDDVVIPTDDPDAWTLYPAHRWIYDKLAVALSQGLDAAPHGVIPPSFPVFSKPMVNLRGMGAGSRPIADAADYQAALTPGHFWSTLLEGAHVSTDVALVNGVPCWWRHTTGITGPGGTFDYWHIAAAPMPEIETHCGAWARQHLAGYTGMANLETIGARIIEAHLRFADQWPDLYGPGWIEAVVALYATGEWRFPDTDRRDGFSVVLFGPHHRRYHHPPAAALAALTGISSVQITFDPAKDPAHHPMPPGGFRLAVINTANLPAGFAVRQQLAAHFGVNPL